MKRKAHIRRVYNPMDDRKYLKKVMETPEGEFERAQAKRLRAFSTRYDEIITIRKKLKEMKDDLEASEESLSFQKEMFTRTDEIPKFRNRYYDRSILKARPRGFLGRFTHYFELKRQFKEKYGKKSPVSVHILNYLIHGALFYPSDEVCSFVQEILILQEELREPVRRMYTSGWLDKIGADVLTPLEFNLVSELERLTADPSIFNFLIHRKKPHIAIEKVNPFLGYFLSLTRSSQHRAKLYNAVRKSLQKITSPDICDIALIDNIVFRIERLLSEHTLNRFIIPLFECAFMKPLSSEEILKMVSLDEIDETCYRADTKLIEVMEERKHLFNEALKKSIFALEEELNYVLDLKASLEAPYELLGNRSGNFLDYLRYYYYQTKKLPCPHKDSNLAITAGDLCDIFTLSYETILSEGCSIKIANDIKTVRIFEIALFQREIDAIRTNRRALINYDRKRYTPHILYSNSREGEEAFFLKSLSEISDAFYSIGEKMYHIIKGNDESSLKEEKTTDMLINERNMGKTRIPFATHVISGKESQMYMYTVANRKVREVLEDIKIFAFNFAYFFEPKKRDFSASVRKETIAQKIQKLDEIITQIRELDSGKIHGR